MNSPQRIAASIIAAVLSIGAGAPAAQAQADTAPSRTWKPARPAGVPRGDQ